VWSSRDITVKNIVQPAQQTTAAVNVRPSPDAPIRNPVLRYQDLVNRIRYEGAIACPEQDFASQCAGDAAGAADAGDSVEKRRQGDTAGVMSASTIQLQEGTATLPLINEVAPAPYAGSLTAGQPKTWRRRAKARRTVRTMEQVLARPPATRRAIKLAMQPAMRPLEAGLVGRGRQWTGRSGGQRHQWREPTHSRAITLPKDGKFGVVVVGSSLAEEFPETVHLWTGRMAYTVYLRVGVGKNWILQYSLPHPGSRLNRQCQVARMRLALRHNTAQHRLGREYRCHHGPWLCQHGRAVRATGGGFSDGAG